MIFFLRNFSIGEGIYLLVIEKGQLPMPRPGRRMTKALRRRHRRDKRFKVDEQVRAPS